MSYNYEVRELLKEIVKDLSEYNGADTLGGYLNGLAVKYNYQLDSLDLPQIEYCKRYPIEVTYSELRGEIYVDHPASDTRLFTVMECDIPDKIDLHSDLELLEYIEENYRDILDDQNF